ncbi:hypothetical protein [Kitasatospora sp. NPDC093679]
MAIAGLFAFAVMLFGTGLGLAVAAVGLAGRLASAPARRARPAGRARG